MVAEQCWLVRSHYSDAITLFACLITFEAHTESKLCCTGKLLVKKKVVPSAASPFVNYSGFVLTESSGRDHLKRKIKIFCPPSKVGSGKTDRKGNERGSS